MELSDLERRIRSFFKADPRGVAAVYIFGSAARGDPKHHDVDVGVLFGEEPPSTLQGLCLDMGADLEKALDCPVDLVVLNGSPVDLAHRVLRDGRLAFERDPSTRIQFEIRVRNEFFDLEPILREYRRRRGARS